MKHILHPFHIPWSPPIPPHIRFRSHECRKRNPMAITYNRWDAYSALFLRSHQTTHPFQWPGLLSYFLSFVSYSHQSVFFCCGCSSTLYLLFRVNDEDWFLGALNNRLHIHSSSNKTHRMRSIVCRSHGGGRVDQLAPKNSSILWWRLQWGEGSQFMFVLNHRKSCPKC